MTSKVKYHQHCRHHEAVKKAKRMLLAAIKKAEYNKWWHQLTGVVYEDAGHLKYVIRERTKTLAVNMKTEAERNDKDLTCDFNFNHYLNQLQFIKELETIMYFIQDDYPDDIHTYEFILPNPEATPDEKERAYKQHFEHKPLLGWNKHFFIHYKDGKRRQVWTLTSSLSDLIDAIKIEITYQ